MNAAIGFAIASSSPAWRAEEMAGVPAARPESRSAFRLVPPPSPGYIIPVSRPGNPAPWPTSGT
jgi:hypothetical protein